MSYKYLVKLANVYDSINDERKANIIDRALSILAEEDVEEENELSFFQDFFNNVYQDLDMSTKNLLDTYISSIDEMMSEISHKYDLSSISQPLNMDEVVDQLDNLLNLMKDDSSNEALYIKEALKMLKVSIESFQKAF
jgi:hypothetical protein